MTVEHSDEDGTLHVGRFTYVRRDYTPKRRGQSAGHGWVRQEPKAEVGAEVVVLLDEIVRLTPRASRHLHILDHFCRVAPDLVDERMREHRPISWDGFTPLDCESCGKPWPCPTEAARLGRNVERSDG